MLQGGHKSHLTVYSEKLACFECQYTLITLTLTRKLQAYMTVMCSFCFVVVLLYVSAPQTCSHSHDVSFPAY